jgi:hypothetical protein
MGIAPFLPVAFHGRQPSKREVKHMSRGETTAFLLATAGIGAWLAIRADRSLHAFNFRG